MTETLWKNKLNFAKDIPMMCADCIKTVMIVSEEKVGGITCVLFLVHIRYLQQMSVCILLIGNLLLLFCRSFLLPPSR
jgi:hypothetical protein